MSTKQIGKEDLAPILASHRGNDRAAEVASLRAQARIMFGAMASLRNRRGWLLSSLLAAACGTTGPGPLPRVPVGTWGADDAGMIVRDADAHVHIGCTLGDVTGPILLDLDGRFDVPGTYNVDAFPVDRGVLHPARFAGATDGRTLTLLVRLTDTDQRLGPATLTLGREPRMSSCPICRP